MKKCQNCEKSFEGDYCNYCGQKFLHERLNIKDIITNTFDLFFNVDKGIILTTKELTIRPGNVARQYIQGKRTKYFSPFKFLFVFIALNTILSQYGIKSKMIDVPDTESKYLFILLNDYWDILSLLLLPIFAALSRLMFKEYKLNYTENLAVNSYVLGYQNLLSSIYYIILLIFCPNCGSGIYPMLLGLLFFIWCYMRFFSKNLLTTFLRLIIVFILGWTIWSVLLFGLIWIIK